MAVQAIEKDPRVERVTYFFAEFVGPDRLLVAARGVIAGEPTQTELARILHDLELRVMEHKSVARAIFALATPEDVATPGGSVQDAPRVAIRSAR
jgi:hypothetical protein